MSRMKIALLGVSLLLFSGAAMALDVSDISQMLKSDVQDSVIINMVQSQKLDRPLTAQEVVLLNSSGASPALLEYLTRPEAVSSSYVASRPAPTVVAGSSAPVYQQPAPTVVTGSSAPVYAQPAPTVMTNTCPTTTYVNPNYIYPAPTVVYPSYSSYYYPYYYPTYRSRPSYSFSFGFGSGRHWGRGPGWGGPRYHRRR